MRLPLAARFLALVAVGTTCAMAAASGASQAGTSFGAVRAGPEYVPGEVVVRFKATADRVDRAAALRAADAERKQWLRLPGAELLALAPGTTVAGAIRDLETNPDVLYAEPNYIYRATATPNDPRYAQLWGLNQASDRDIDAPEAWDVTTGSAAVKVA